jgi:hypothetical protein
MKRRREEEDAAAVPPFRGPAADSTLGELFLDVIGPVAAMGFAANVSQCVYVCGLTFRHGDRGATKRHAHPELATAVRRARGSRGRARGFLAREAAVQLAQINAAHARCHPEQPSACTAAHAAWRAARCYRQRNELLGARLCVPSALLDGKYKGFGAKFNNHCRYYSP